MYDVDDAVTTTFADATKIVFEFWLWKRIEGNSFADVIAVTDSAATFEYNIPALGSDGS